VGLFKNILGYGIPRDCSKSYIRLIYGVKESY
jgi:hypothetical protein